MNFRNKTAAVSLLALSLLFSCNEDEAGKNQLTENQGKLVNTKISVPLSEYYIQFTANGDLITEVASEVPFNGGGELATCNIPPDTDEFAGIQMVNSSLAQITAAQIESWVGTTFTMDSLEPHPGFFIQGEEFYFSDWAENPSLTMTITAVEFIGTQILPGHPEQKLYKVSGTFSGKVRNFERTKTLIITDGSFVIGFAEGLM